MNQTSNGSATNISKKLSNDTFSLVYFTADPEKASQAFASGVSAVLVDCENKDKEQRQTGFNTEINYYTPRDVAKIRAVSTDGHIICRVNAAGTATNHDDIELAIASGVDTILLPLTESRDDIIETREIIDGRAALIIMIETETGYQNVEELVAAGPDAIYVGLNDFSISRQGAPLFEPLVDGTIEEIIQKSTVPVGVGGVTDPSAGHPIRSADIIREYERIGVRFSILRRSFEKAIEEDTMQNVVDRIKSSYHEASRRDTSAKKIDLEFFKSVVQKGRI